MTVSLGIALFLATKLVVVGLVMAIWSVVAIAVLPILKGLNFLATSPRLQGKRRRAIAMVAALCATALAALFLIPLPYSTVVEGVIVVPDRSEVRAKTDGFVNAVLVPPDATVQPHQALVRLEDPTLEAKATVLDAELDETRQRLGKVQMIDLVQERMFEEQAAHLAERVAAIRKQERDLDIVADLGGRFLAQRVEDLPGRYLKRGELVGYVVPDDRPVVRVLAPQGDVDLISRPTTSVEARLAEDPAHALPAKILRTAPAAQQDVPSLALTTRGGGSIALDPSRTQRPQTLFSFFQFDVQLLEPPTGDRLGARAYVRFKHPDEPIAWRMLRVARQFFLGQFRV
jgi:putative peptide zinc metalloprotease protein